MQWLDNLVDKWHAFWDKPRPGWKKFGDFWRKVGAFLAKLWKYLFALRGLILSIPVATAAVILAAKSMTDLPSSVEVTLPGIRVGSDNSLFGFLVFHTQQIPKGTAVLVPLVLTAACLLLTMCSKRALYPWIISLFTLIVPVFLLVTNVYL